MNYRRKLSALALTAILALSVGGCTPNSPVESEPSDVVSQFAESTAENDTIVVKTPEAPYFENLDDFNKNAEPFDSDTDGNTLLKKAISALTADTAHYELTEFGIAENMLGSEVDVITVEVERKNGNIYSKTTKMMDGETTQDEFLTVDGESFRLTNDRTKSIKENPADDIILVTNSVESAFEHWFGSDEEAMSFDGWSTGGISVNGEELTYERYGLGNAAIIAYFKGEEFLRADVYLKSSDTWEYKGYFEGNFNLEMDGSLLKKP